MSHTPIDAAVIARGLSEADTALSLRLLDIGSCSDGSCIIRKPVGLHTNGGCRCNRDPIRMTRYAQAMNKFHAAVRAELEKQHER